MSDGKLNVTETLFMIPIHLSWKQVAFFAFLEIYRILIFGKEEADCTCHQIYVNYSPNMHNDEISMHPGLMCHGNFSITSEIDCQLGKLHWYLFPCFILFIHFFKSVAFVRQSLL